MSDEGKIREPGGDGGPEDDLAPFYEALRDRAMRPPKLLPGAAATRIAARIREDARPRRLGRLVAAASGALLVALLGVVLFVRPRSAPSPNPVALVPVGETTPEPREEIVIWIDEETPLTMTVGPSGPADEKGGDS
jgi:hypothetical protein